MKNENNRRQSVSIIVLVVAIFFASGIAMSAEKPAHSVESPLQVNQLLAVEISQQRNYCEVGIEGVNERVDCKNSRGELELTAQLLRWTTGGIERRSLSHLHYPQ